MQLDNPTLESVRNYYSQVVKTQADLRTSACCTADSFPAYLKPILAKIDGEIQDRSYGCGSPIPLALDGCTVLDLGCGTGRDAYLASSLVGPKGRVIGLDMTEDQLAVAQRHREDQTRRFGFEEPNVEFRSGYIEDLALAGIGSDSIDVVISNCVINLSPDKRAVFAEIFRVLRPGGELFFSDVFSDRRIPETIGMDPILYGECLGGALYTEDFRRLLHDTGFSDFRVTSSSAIELRDPELQKRVGNVQFTSRTVRAFKLPEELEDRCEDYGHIARYLGTIRYAPDAFELDDHHRFETGKPERVCGNTAAMLGATRYHRHFEIIGDRSTHYGLFDCSDGQQSTHRSGDSCC
ncbi:MAG: methyltransferase domain-containing protein [Rhodothermia bacterium]|nr:methyltransferase domain-containing protein [Rhodothermia bacterium]